MEIPRLVASDVDGTLLGPLERVSERTAATVGRVVASDTPFVLVTGRPPRWVPSVAESVGHAGLAVCSNGAVLYDVGRDAVLGAHELDPVLLRDVAHALSGVLPEAALAVERIGTAALSLDGQEFVTEDNYRHPWPGDSAMIAPRDEVLGHPAVKLLIRHHDMTSDELAEVVTTLLDGAVTVTFSSSIGMLELSAPGITKGTGLAEVAQRYGVPAADVIAFGDMPNDVPMLRWAGHGVAMGNAHPEAIAAADEVTAPNGEDGVATVLERWF